MIVYTDGGYNKHGAYGSFALENDDKIVCMHRMFYGDDINTNNTAEYVTIYKALVYCLRKKILNVVIRTDSMLAIKHLTREWRIGKEHLRDWAQIIWDIISQFESVGFEHLPRKYIVAKLGH